MAFKILIVEDEELYADKLEMLVEKLEYDHLGTVDNSSDALALIQKEVPDLILMDIHIQGTHDGIELADLIHKEYAIPIIFITSLQDDLTFARASRTNPVSFLVKPFNDLQLQRVIELTVKKLHESQASDTQQDISKKEKSESEPTDWNGDFLFQKHFFIKTRQKLEKVGIDEVYYLEADGHYCQVHTGDKKFLVRMSMADLSKRLPSDLFLQTHRSFIVNTQKIESVDLQESVIILGEKHVPLSKRNKEELLKKLDWV